MALKISDMPQAAPLTGEELIELVQSGANTKATVQAVADYVAAQQAELEQTVEQLNETQTALSQTLDGLSTTQTALSQTVSQLATTQSALSNTTTNLKAVSDRAIGKTNVLTKCLFGRYNTYNIGSNPYTCNLVMELEGHFTGLRIGIPNISTSAQANIRACVAVVDRNALAAAWQVAITPTGGTWYDLTLNGNPSITLPPRIGAERPSITMLDLAPLESLIRADAGTRPMIMVRIEYPAGTTPSVPYVSTAGWRQADAPRVVKTSTQAVLGVTDKAAYTNTTNTEGSSVVLPIVQYFTKKAGKQLLLIGDSTVEGIGSTPVGCGAAQFAVYNKSTLDAPIEYFNAAVHAQGPDTYQLRLGDVFDLVKPTAVFYSPYSVNGISVGGMTAAERTRIYQYMTDTFQFIRSSRIATTLVLIEPLPCNTNFRDTGAGDQSRRDLITMLSQYTGPIVTTGYAAAVSGTQTASGQTLFAAGASDDGVHPNKNGYRTLLAPTIDPILDVI